MSYISKLFSGVLVSPTEVLLVFLSEKNFWFCGVSSCRCLPVLLDSVLCPPHDASSLSGLPRPPFPDERGDVARLRQQRSEPRHLHCLQHGVQELFQKVPASLLLQECRMRTLLLHGQFINAQQLKETLLTADLVSVFVLPLLPSSVRFYFSTCADSKVCLGFMFPVKKTRSCSLRHKLFRLSAPHLHHTANEKWFYKLEFIFSK